MGQFAKTHFTCFTTDATSREKQSQSSTDACGVVWAETLQSKSDKQRVFLPQGQILFERRVNPVTNN